MTIGMPKYPSRGFLTKRGWAALKAASELLVDELHEDIDSLTAGGDVEDTFVMACEHLPRSKMSMYSVVVFKKFLICVTVVSWKLINKSVEFQLDCVGEELALNAIINRAKVHLEERDMAPVDFGAPEDLLFEDRDFDFLFEPEHDGIEDTPSGKFARIVNLKFNEWFLPFRKEDVLHPYLSA